MAQKEPLGAEEAARLGLPKVIWQQGMYRLVLWQDEEDGTIKRTPERLLGHDLLLGERWGLLGERTWDEQRNEYVVSAEWQYLALQMAEQVPLPAEDSAAEEAGALDQAAEDRARAGSSPQQRQADGEGAYALYQNVEQDEYTAYLSCVPCGCTVTSCEDGRLLATGAFERGWRVRADGRALCPDCASAEPALSLLSAITEDDGGAHLACSLCSWDTIDGFSASAVAEVAAEGGWVIGANGRAVCPTCLLEATVP